MNNIAVHLILQPTFFKRLAPEFRSLSLGMQEAEKTQITLWMNAM